MRILFYSQITQLLAKISCYKEYAAQLRVSVAFNLYNAGMTLFHKLHALECR